MSRPITFDPPVENGLVVGYDGSTPGRRALEWARQEAVAHDWPLHVVRAWTISTAVPEVGAPVGVVPSLDECAAAVTADTRRVLDSLSAGDAASDGDDRKNGDDGDDGRGNGDGGRHGGQPVTYLHVVHGHPNDVLLAAARRADLLVVAHRGHNLMSLVLGSVASYVLDHAPCPVVVLPLASPARG